VRKKSRAFGLKRKKQWGNLKVKYNTGFQKDAGTKWPYVRGEPATEAYSKKTEKNRKRFGVSGKFIGVLKTTNRKR